MVRCLAARRSHVSVRSSRKPRQVSRRYHPGNSLVDLENPPLPACDPSLGLPGDDGEHGCDSSGRSVAGLQVVEGDLQAAAAGPIDGEEGAKVELKRADRPGRRECPGRGPAGVATEGADGDLLGGKGLLTAPFNSANGSGSSGLADSRTSRKAIPSPIVSAPSATRTRSAGAVVSTPRWFPRPGVRP